MAKKESGNLYEKLSETEQNQLKNENGSNLQE
jgi:hypothetical protein